MKVVIDSSVLISAITHPGVCTDLLDTVVENHTFIYSDYILEEVSRKLHEKFQFPKAKATAIATALKNQGDSVIPAAIPTKACRDPNDLPVLGTALAGQVDFLVTVDKDMLSLGKFHGIPVIRPGEFLRRLRQSKM